MSTVVTWEVHSQSVQIGEEVIFTAEGLASFEQLPVYILLPNNQTFLWVVKANQNGRVRESLKLDSGLGQYVFCPKPSCGLVNPSQGIVNLCPCMDSDTGCSISVDGPDRLLKGQEYTFKISGLRPSYRVQAKLASVDQVTSFREEVSDVEGNLYFKLTWNVSGQYALTFSDGTCISTPYILDVVEDINFPVGVIPKKGDDCQSAIEIRAVPNKSRYSPNEVGTVRVYVTNHSANSRVLSFLKLFDFADGSLTTDGIPDNDIIPGYSVKEYILIFRAGLTDSTITGKIQGSYPCDNLYFSANGSGFNAAVGAGQGICSAILDYFGPVGSLEIEPNEEGEIEVIFRNVGTTTITSLVLNQLNIPDDATLMTSLPLAFGAIAPGTTSTQVIKIKFSELGTHTVHLPEGSVKYSCGGDEIGIPQPGFVTFNVKESD